VRRPTAATGGGSVASGLFCAASALTRSVAAIEVDRVEDDALSEPSREDAAAGLAAVGGSAGVRVRPPGASASAAVQVVVMPPVISAHDPPRVGASPDSAATPGASLGQCLGMSPERAAAGTSCGTLGPTL
jgi:hypothetical protein